MCELEADVEIWADEPTLDSNVGLNLVYTLEQDPNRKEQLAGFRDETSDTRRKAALHRENEQQLLEEGKLAQSEFSARLQKGHLCVLSGPTGLPYFVFCRFLSQKSTLVSLSHCDGRSRIPARAAKGRHVCRRRGELHWFSRS